MEQQITRKDLMSVKVDQQVFNVEVKQITMTAGQTAVKHLHPCPVAGYIVSGSVLFQIEGKESEILKEGDSFYEPRKQNYSAF